AGGTVLDCRSLDRVLDADPAAGTVRVEAGISLAGLLAFALPRGLFLPVSPGTSQVSVGGAIAADVHGKNHHRDGTFGAHVEAMRLLGPGGERSLDPRGTPEAFWASVGGMGLTGILTEATVRLQPVETSSMVVTTRRADDLESCMAVLSEEDESTRYSVAWVDAAARGARLGRSVVTLGDHARLDELSKKARRDPLAVRLGPRLSVPIVPPVNLVTPMTVAAFNEAFFRRAPRTRAGEIQHFTSFFYPLDVAAHWNRLYGPRGFTQYQFVVPFSESATVRSALELLQKAGAPSSLAVLKRFGPSDPAPLSFPDSGWTLALDLALGTPGLPEALDELDALVAGAGGRVYLAKDGRLRPELLAAMYPRLDQWRHTRSQLDPEGCFVSDLARRVGLVA
ncbi:MAG: oxidoreductase, partial [Acidimicrobiaceae bacterium]|nr:oxidoreductase [Acidimicrobiaceae bacterium]